MSDYQPQNRLNHYKSYHEYSLLCDAVVGRTKDLNEVTKSLILSLCFWKTAKRHCKPCGLQQGLRLRVINAIALKGRAACGKQKKTTPQDDGLLWRIAKTNRISWVTQLSQKWSCTLGRKVSTATTFRRLREMGFRCLKPATKPLLNCKHKLKRLQWANMHKDAQWLDVWTMLKIHF